MNNPTDPIARRSLTCLLEGHRQQVEVALRQPYAKDDIFVCEYEIIIGGIGRAYKIIGIDGIQAIQLSLFMIGSALSALPGASEWKWNSETSTGFPARLEEIS
jgi:hypothetical protein